MLARMKLYNYFRSSASFRVRIALELKGLGYDYVPIHLPSGEQRGDGYRAMAPEALVPVLELPGGERLSQSMAIVEYLDETHPEPPLLPRDATGRARVRALAQAIACDIHPVTNLRVLQYLTQDLQAGDAARLQWYRHWTRQGLDAFEALLAGASAGPFCHGDAPTLADCCLAPLIFNARRFDVVLDGLPRTLRAFDACMALPAFQRAQPSSCPDHVA